MLTFLKHCRPRIILRVWTQFNERLLNIDTIGNTEPAREARQSGEWWRGPKTEKAKNDDNLIYCSPDYWHIRKSVNIVKPRPTDVVYDLGSGMGRILCVFARRNLKKCVGIELFEDLCKIASHNAEALAGRKAPIEIRCEDASSSDISDGTIFFLFNPFGAATLRDVLKNIKHSIDENKRQIQIIYYNAVHAAELERCDWLMKYHEFYTLSGMNVTFWKNQ
jgi:SAM-dependent methyltransferase